MEINVFRVEFKTVTKNEKIAHNTKKTEDSSLIIVIHCQTLCVNANFGESLTNRICVNIIGLYGVIKLLITQRKRKTVALKRAKQRLKLRARTENAP